VILLKFLKILRDSRTLATILTLLCHSQDSVAIHINCINPILDLILEDFLFFGNFGMRYRTVYCSVRNTVNTFKRQLDLCLKNWEYL